MKILYKRIVPLTIITTMITSNCIVFARDSKFLSSETGFKANFVGDIISDAADLDNIEITQNNIIDIVNEIDDSAMVTQDDIIVKEDKNG
ncbi:MAG: hypothetical protein PHY44_02965 [Lachnospiraceae bacterium]|nr:hypothetical protein [Lachnospiraceae bacterium]